MSDSSPSRYASSSRPHEQYPVEITGYQSERPTPAFDLDYYIRKVNRYETQIVELEELLSLTRFKLAKAEDTQVKYDALFQEHHTLIDECAQWRVAADKAKQNQAVLLMQIDKLASELKLAKTTSNADKQSLADAKRTSEKTKVVSHSLQEEEKQQLVQQHTRELDKATAEFEETIAQLRREVLQADQKTAFTQIELESVKSQLAAFKQDKSSSEDSLRTTVAQLQTEASQAAAQSLASKDANLRRWEQWASQTSQSLMDTCGQIQNVLLTELKDAHAALEEKNKHIDFLLTCDSESLKRYEQETTDLRRHVQRLEDKIFVIQREDYGELVKAIRRLSSQYKGNMEAFEKQFLQVRETHSHEVSALKKEVETAKRELQLLGRENKTLEEKHQQLSQEKENEVRMLSNQLIQLEGVKDTDLRNYTTSMQQIESEAKEKMDDLHKTILSKEGEVAMLNAQLAIQHAEITHLLEEMSQLRAKNREKLEALFATNAQEQDNLLQEIAALKKTCLQLRSTVNSLEEANRDLQVQAEAEVARKGNELQVALEQREYLRGQNEMIRHWCGEMERQLKKERENSVNILHDHSSAKRENVHTREEVRVEVEAQRDKVIEQLRNVHQLERGRLEQELRKKDQELREKKEELGRIMVQYKALEAKVGKSTRVDRSAEDIAKCKATLEAEIHLAENIFNAINT